MIGNDELLALALNGLEPAEADALRAKLKDDTAAQLHLARIQKLLAPLEADQDHPAPPANLTAKTLRAFDASLARPKPRGAVAGHWLELAVAASIGLVGFGLVITAINRFQADNQRMACQNNLRAISVGLNNYADRHNGRFPKVGEGVAIKAGQFRQLLEEEQNWPADASTHCSANPDRSTPVGYNYTLGHRDGRLRDIYGHIRESETAPYLPIIADFPASSAGIPGPSSPHGRGHNVLFADGHVDYYLSPALGRDNIFINDENQRRAGLHRNDHVLGHPDVEP